jgi:hypothetical protein
MGDMPTTTTPHPVMATAVAVGQAVKLIGAAVFHPKRVHVDPSGHPVVVPKQQDAPIDAPAEHDTTAEHETAAHHDDQAG